MKKFIDLHAHPFKEYFDNPEDILKTAKKNGVDRIFIVGTDLINSEEVKLISAQFDYTFPIIGIHPNDAKNYEDLLKLRKLMDNTIVGIGEVGFDFHYEDSPSKEQQGIFLKYQIELAIEFDIPVIIHTRDAAEETFNILKLYKEKFPDFKIVIHSYSYGAQWVDKFISIGAYLSFSGVITFKNAIDAREAVFLTPIEKIFCETDTPYLTPVPFRGKTNKPEYVIYTAQEIAKIKGISIEQLNQQMNNNLEKLFNLKKAKNG